MMQSIENYIFVLNVENAWNFDDFLKAKSQN